MPNRLVPLHTLAACAALLAPALALGAPAPPSSPHPRLFLTADMLTALKADAMKAGTTAASLVKRCDETISSPQDYDARGGVDGDTWPGGAVSCAFAWKVTGTQKYLDSAIALWNTSLNDDQMRGDGAGCVMGAGTDAATQTVRHDTGYPMRWYAPFLALTYDWLHDAPGVDAALLSHTRFCFKAWVDYYTSDGYLHDVPGANYGAGYVAGKTLIAIAEAGEDGATSDGYWTAAVDEVFGKMLVGKGLAGAKGAVGSPAGVMVGGDWAEGWQYGPLSVLEYAFAARALADNGAPQPEMDAWAGDVALNYMYAQSPARDAFYSDGDLESDSVYPDPNGRILRTVFGGTTNADALGFARFLWDKQKPGAGSHPFEAIADVLGAKVTAKDFDAAGKPTWYLARGTRRVYARSSFTDPSAAWSVFMGGGALVPDHDHFDAGNVVLSRGGDYLLVDPSAYGSRSTLPSNAPTVNADTVMGDYKPSQTPWSDADLSWARGVESGVCAASADYAKAFTYSSTPSDIPYAHRDWVFLPEGEVVLLDRVRSNNAGESLILNFHSQKTLTLSGTVATATVGSSGLAIHGVVLSGAMPSVQAVPHDESCYKGSCSAGRFETSGYTVTLPGPKAVAVHVLDALAGGETPATVGSLNDAPYDDAGGNAAVVGAAVFRSSKQSYVLASSAQDGKAGASLAYSVPGGSAARHVVFDAPEDSSGKSDVTASASGDRCSISIKAGSTYSGHPLMFQTSAAMDGCKVTEDLNVPPGSTPPSTPSGSGGQTGSGGKTGTGGRTSGGAGGAGGAPAGGSTAQSGVGNGDGGTGTGSGGTASGDGGAGGEGGGAAQASESSSCAVSASGRRAFDAWSVLLLAGLVRAFRRRRRSYDLAIQTRA